MSTTAVQTRGVRQKLRSSTLVARQVLARLVHLGLSLGVLIGIWYAFIAALHLNAYFAKTPSATWNYLTSGAESGAHRTVLFNNFYITLEHGGVGFGAGLVVAGVIAIVLVLWPTVGNALMPIIVSVRVVPLVAMTPLLALIFGRGLVGVVVIAALVTFFPTLVNVVAGMQSVPVDMLNVMRSYNASPAVILRKVRAPRALPELFASARITAPTAIGAALLAEWLVTGNGLGNLMVYAGATSDYGMVWAAAALITLASFLVYEIVRAFEQTVLGRLGFTEGRSA